MSNFLSRTLARSHSYTHCPIGLLAREVMEITLNGEIIHSVPSFGAAAEISAATLKFVNQRSALGWRIVDNRILILED